MTKYDLRKGKKKIIKKEESKKVEDKVDKILDIKQLDMQNPLEQAIKYDMIKRNPPNPHYMEVSKKEVTVMDDDGNEDKFIVTESKQDDGKKLRIIQEPIRVVDLNTSILADVARCPSHIGPMLIDEYVKVNLEEKQEFKAEKRREPFRYWWVLVLLLMLPGLILIILMFI